MKKLFINQIKDASEERDIEHVYKNNLEEQFRNSKITYPFKCDGYLEDTIMYDEQIKVLRLIMEFKYGMDFNDSSDRAEVLIQVLFYLKQFILRKNKDYIEIPNVILAGDKTTCFILSSDEIKNYLEKQLNWNIAPSKASVIYKKVVEEIRDDKSLNPIIFNINKNFKFDLVVKDIKRLILDIKIKFKVTESNISEIYDYFIERIIKNPSSYSASDLVQCFIDAILGESEISQKKNSRYIAKKERRIEIDSYNYSKFEEEYSVKYSLEDKNKFIAIKDRLTEDTKRRFNGEFFTPTIWVNEAHRIIGDVLGENWRNEYVVWDYAWGTGNLTRDYYFNELYCSTLDKIDLELGENYNINSNKFVYDFLNEDYELLYSIDSKNKKIPDRLYKDLIMNKKLLFFINPPFAESSNGKQAGKKSKDGISKTKVKLLMESEGLKNDSQQIYIQFLYRILNIKKIFKLENVAIGVFLPTLFLSGERSESFRDIFLDNFKYEKGILFNASYFSNVSSEWGIGFSIWTSGKGDKKDEFKFIVKELSDNRKIINVGKKLIYNVSKKRRLSEWIPKQKICTESKTITLTSALKTNNREKTTDKNAIGFLMNDSNNVYANTQGVYIQSAPVSRHVKTTTITKENYKKCFSLYSARKIIKSNWLNQKDNYMIPNVKDSRYEQWEKDSIIYSIFSGETSSLRNIVVNNESYDITNELFFMSKNEIERLSNEFRNEEVYWDCKKYNNDKFIYSDAISKIKFPKESQKVLDNGIKLVEESFKYRSEFNHIYPEYNINTWDAGWYQIKGMLKIYMKKDLEDFNKYMSELEEKMRNMIYELGFLRK